MNAIEIRRTIRYISIKNMFIKELAFLVKI